MDEIIKKYFIEIVVTSLAYITLLTVKHIYAVRDKMIKENKGGFQDRQLASFERGFLTV